MKKLYILLFILLATSQIASAAWWNDSYQYTSSTSINNPNNTTMVVTLNNSTGSNTGTTIFTDGSLLENCHSINTTKNNLTEIPFFLINNSNSGTCQLIINISTATISDSIDIYWTNIEDFGSASNLSATCIICDNFNSNSSDPNWTEIDAGSQLIIDRITNKRLDISGLSNAAANERIFYDYGNDPGNFIYNFTFERTEINVVAGILIGLSDTNASNAITTWQNGIYVDLYVSGLAPAILFRARHSGIEVSNDSTYIWAINTPYYGTIKRIGDIFTMDIYSDTNRLNLLTEQTINQSGVGNDLRYIYAVTNLGNGGSTASGFVDDLYLTKYFSPMPSFNTWENFAHIFTPPAVINVQNSTYNFGVNRTWQPGAGVVSNFYNVTRNGSWYNGTNPYLNTSCGVHGWCNDTIFAFNSSGNGSLGSGVSQNTQVPNNPIIINNIATSYILYAGQTLNIYPTYSDADGDAPTFDRNFTQGTFNNGTGETNWTTGLGDIGTYNMDINASDGFGSTDTKSFTVYVLDLNPINLNAIKITAKTISWSWINPTSPFYQCTEIWFNGVYQSCDSSSSKYFTGLTPNTGYEISLRVKDISNNLYSFVNNTSTTLTTTTSPTITSLYTQNWFSPALSQNFPISINYNSSLVPIQSISIEIRTKDENDYVRTFTSGTYTFDPLITNTSKTLNWDGKGDNFQIVPDAYYIAQITATDYDSNTDIFTNSSYIGVDTTTPSSIMAIEKSRLFQSFYYKSNYNSQDPLRINLGQYYGDYNTSSYIIENPITGDSTLSNLVIRKTGYITTTADDHTFTITKDADGDAWMWVDGMEVYNSNAGVISTQISLSAGQHEIAIEYSKGTTSSPITLIPKMDASDLIYTNPNFNNSLNLFAFDFNGSGINNIKYSLDDGLTYQTYNSPINTSGAHSVYVCSIDNTSNHEICKGYSPEYTLPEIPPPPNASTPPQYQTPNPTPQGFPTPPPTPPGVPPPTPPPDNNTQNEINNSQDDNESKNWNNSWNWNDWHDWHIPSYGQYIFNFFDKHMYFAAPEAVNYIITVYQFNINFNAKVETINSNGNISDRFEIYQYPWPWQLKTKKTKSLKGEPFGIFRSDITKYLLADPWFEYLTSAYAVYSPGISITTGNYNLNDTIIYNVSINAWDDNDSSTLEIPDVSIILYSPQNPYTGEYPKLIQINNITTVTRAGGFWTFNYSTNLYTDLIGDYTIIFWAPLLGGYVTSSNSNVGYGSIDPADYNQIKANQYYSSLSGQVSFNDTNGTNHPLPGALIYLNSTINTTTDGTGAYSLTGINGTFTITAQKSAAYSTSAITRTITTNTTQDFILNYSKGTLGSPNLQNGRITTQYNNNLRAINPWELPSFVWVATKYDAYNGTANDKWYYKAANYDGGNQFSINVEKNKGNYFLYFSSSDLYNNPTSGWHPTINITRYFNSTEIYINQGNIGEQIVHRSIASREQEAKTNFWGIGVFLIFVLLLIAASSKLKEVRR